MERSSSGSPKRNVRLGAGESAATPFMRATSFATCGRKKAAIEQARSLHAKRCGRIQCQLAQILSAASRQTPCVLTVLAFGAGGLSPNRNAGATKPLIGSAGAAAVATSVELAVSAGGAAAGTPNTKDGAGAASLWPPAGRNHDGNVSHIDKGVER